MANSLRGESSVELGGVVRVLRFDNNALASLEQLMGRGILSIVGDQSQVLSVAFIRNALAVGLQAAGAKRATPQKVGEMMTPGVEALGVYAEAVLAGVFGALGIDAEKMQEAEGGDPLGSQPTQPTASTGEE